MVRLAGKSRSGFVNDATVDSIDVGDDFRSRRIVSQPCPEKLLGKLGCDRRMAFADFLVTNSHEASSVVLPMMLVASITAIVKPILLLQHLVSTYEPKRAL